MACTPSQSAETPLSQAAQREGDSGWSSEELATLAVLESVREGIALVEATQRGSARVERLLWYTNVTLLRCSTEVISGQELDQLEVTLLLQEAEVERVLDTSRYEGVQLLDGSTASVDITIDDAGAGADTLTLELPDLSWSALGITPSFLGEVFYTTCMVRLDDLRTPLLELRALRSRLAVTHSVLSDIAASLEDELGA
jgi:hypothetical protein